MYQIYIVKFYVVCSLKDTNYRPCNLMLPTCINSYNVEFRLVSNSKLHKIAGTWPWNILRLRVILNQI
jgi:hypothetical protein